MYIYIFLHHPVNDYPSFVQVLFQQNARNCTCVAMCCQSKSCIMQCALQVMSFLIVGIARSSTLWTLPTCAATSGADSAWMAVIFLARSSHVNHSNIGGVAWVEPSSKGGFGWGI